MRNPTCYGKTIAVILAAGRGLRMDPARELKQFLDLEGKLVVLHSVETFAACPSVDEIVVVVPPGRTARVRDLLQRADVGCPFKVVVGGKRRQDSSFKSLQTLSGRKDVGLVAIHDAARPLITPEVIERAIHEAKKHGASVVATKTTDTVFEVRAELVVSILDREPLYNAQTPQVFRFDLIWEGHEAARRDGVYDATDDVQLVLRLGKTVKLVDSSPDNIKITTERDFVLASLILKERLSARETVEPGRPRLKSPGRKPVGRTRHGR
jgi:2-C-methyl-D-erythritol 4-phosphate cytidylyltransferase